MGERWQPVKGFEQYEVSNLGRIRSLKFGKERIIKYAINKARKSPRRNAYAQVRLPKNGKRHHFMVHRLVANAFCEKPRGWTDNIKEWVVNHKNNNPQDNRASNLNWVTRSENLRWCPRCNSVYGQPHEMNHNPGFIPH